jgi:hypothetical protein
MTRWSWCSPHAEANRSRGRPLRLLSRLPRRRVPRRMPFLAPQALRRAPRRIPFLAPPALGHGLRHPHQQHRHQHPLRTAIRATTRACRTPPPTWTARTSGRRCGSSGPTCTGWTRTRTAGAAKATADAGSSSRAARRRTRMVRPRFAPARSARQVYSDRVVVADNDKSVSTRWRKLAG